MALRRPLVEVAGQIREIAIGDQIAADTYAAPVGGGGGTIYSATLTLPTARYEHEEVVSVSGLLPTKKLTVSIAPHLDTDENDASMLDVLTLSAVAGNDDATVSASFTEQTSGPIKIYLTAF